MSFRVTLLAGLAITLGSVSAFAQQAAPKPVGVVSHIKVLSDKVPDVSSVEAWKKAFITDQMTDQDKALAIWKSNGMFVYQDIPPVEHLHEGCVHDPIKSFNVYGYGMCCCASARVEALGRYLGMEARGWGLTGHSVPELKWDGSWHLLDASLLNYFTKDDGKIASVEEISAAVQGYLKEHPELKANNGKLSTFQQQDAWTGWKKGPGLLANCRFYGADGWWPARTHGWFSTMQEFDGTGGGADGKAFNYEYAYSMGYQVNIQLRPGERLIRNWSNTGMHINGQTGKGGEPGSLKPHDFLANARKFNNELEPKWPDVTTSRVGSGIYEYDLPLSDGSFALGMLRVDNIASKADDNAAPAIHLKDAGKQGILEFEMPSSYVYLTGKVAVNATVGDGGNVRFFLSDNNGLDWTDVATIDKSGQQTLDVSKQTLSRYTYRMRVILAGKGTGLDALKVTHDVQCSQRALPALAAGGNTITFSAGPSEGTVTIEGTSYGENKKNGGLLLTDFNPTLDKVANQYFQAQGDGATVTFPISTPADMKRLRFGAHYRLRDQRDAWEASVSFDGGKTFKVVDKQTGPYQGICKSMTVTDIPANTKEAQVRWTATVRNTTCLFLARIDADYAQPAGGFRPVQVTYLWEEGGIEQKDVHVARTPEDTWKIKCAGKPTMKSITLELAK